MSDPQYTAVSDFHKLALLDLFGIPPKATEYNGRYWAYFNKSDVDGLLADYEAGHLKVTARDYVSAISRVKDRIFELERAHTRSGFKNANHCR